MHYYPPTPLVDYFSRHPRRHPAGQKFIIFSITTRHPTATRMAAVNSWWSLWCIAVKIDRSRVLPAATFVGIQQGKNPSPSSSQPGTGQPYWWLQWTRDDVFHALPCRWCSHKHSLPPSLIGTHTVETHHLHNHNQASARPPDGGIRLGVVS